MNALILVDIQNDFLAGGPLAVPDGEEIFSGVQRLIDGHPLVVATQDWHPPGHGSFASSHAGRRAGELVELAGHAQVLWPDHCVQGTPGAAFSTALDLRTIRAIVRKGTQMDTDSYSGFFDDNGAPTGLDGLLRQLGAHSLTIVGLATDYCVKATVIDALRLGYSVTVESAACRAVNIQPGDGAAAFQEMANAGAAVR